MAACSKVQCSCSPWNVFSSSLLVSKVKCKPMLYEAADIQQALQHQSVARTVLGTLGPNVCFTFDFAALLPHRECLRSLELLQARLQLLRKSNQPMGICTQLHNKESLAKSETLALQCYPISNMSTRRLSQIKSAGRNRYDAATGNRCGQVPAACGHKTAPKCPCCPGLLWFLCSSLPAP